MKHRPIALIYEAMQDVAGSFMARQALRHWYLRGLWNGTSTPKVLTVPKHSFRHVGLRRAIALACAVIATVQIVAFVPADAQAFWSGTTSSDWFTGSNWVGGTIPTTAADAILDTIVPNPTVVNGPGAQALDLVVGGLGTGALTIGSGGTVNNGVGHVGGCSGCGTGTFGTVTVSGAGATWTNSAGLAIGDSSTGQLTIANGGKVLTGSTGGFIGVRPGATGTVTVTDPGSTWNITDQLVVAGFLGPASGTLFVQNGGAVTSTAGTIGFSSGSTGAVSVTGTGSTWASSGNVTVGLAGTGTLTAARGAAVHVRGGPAAIWVA